MSLLAVERAPPEHGPRLDEKHRLVVGVHEVWSQLVREEPASRSFAAPHTTSVQNADAGWSIIRRWEGDTPVAVLVVIRGTPVALAMEGAQRGGDYPTRAHFA
jgi:hypothetical protein